MATVADARDGVSPKRHPARQFYVYETFDDAKSGWHSFSAKHPTGISSREIETLGEALARGLGYEPGSDIRGLVGKMRGALMIAPVNSSSESVEGALLVRDGSPEFKIIVPAASSSRRDQLTVAKALGHYFLHHRYFEFEKAQKRSSSKSLADQEALTFALAFLMPKDDFKRALKTAHGKTDIVAASFGVPVEAAERRRKFIPE